jgi:hypothetical protein
MLKLINTSTAFYGAGLSIQRKLFKIGSGAYAGRIAAVFPLSATAISLSYSDPPYLSWSSPQTVISDSADFPSGCWMDSGGNIYTVYTASGSLNLIHKKLNFSDGSWSTGTAYTIYNADANYYPSIFKDKYGRLWVSWTRHTGGNYCINVKCSIDDGATWDFGPDDPGTTLTSGSSSAWSRLVYLPTYLYCFYSEGGTKLAYRRFEMAGGLWYSETEVYTGSGLADNFATAVADDMKLGLVFVSDGDLLYKDFDGAAWSGNFSLDDEITVAPVLKYNGSIPFVFYGKDIGDNQNQLFYTSRSGSGFALPERVCGEVSAFDKALCYRPSATVKYYDRSGAAADSTAGDVYHVESGKLIADVGDALLIGQAEKFQHMQVVLSTNGVGGVVGWYYWDGSNWKHFTPKSGEYNFDASPSLVRLWEDASEMPSDWQSSVINGFSMFWVKAAVTSAFGTSPVGSQITAAKEIPYLTVL